MISLDQWSCLIASDVSIRRCFSMSTLVTDFWQTRYFVVVSVVAVFTGFVFVKSRARIMNGAHYSQTVAASRVYHIAGDFYTFTVHQRIVSTSAWWDRWAAVTSSHQPPDLSPLDYRISRYLMFIAGSFCTSSQPQRATLCCQSTYSYRQEPFTL